MDSAKMSRLGEILVRSRRLKPHQLGVALAVQRKRKIPIGKLLVEVKIITPTQLWLALLKQKLLRLRARFFAVPARLRDMGMDFSFRSQRLLEEHLASLGETSLGLPREKDEDLRTERSNLPRGRIARIVEKNTDLAERIRTGNF